MTCTTVRKRTPDGALVLVARDRCAQTRLHVQWMHQRVVPAPAVRP